MADEANVIKTWQTGEVIHAEDMNRIEANAANALSLSKTNETDIAAIESGQTHSMVADTQAPTVPTNLKVTVGLIPVWKAGADVLLRSAVVDIQASAEVTLTAGTVLATGLSVKANQTYAVWFHDADGTMSHNTLATNSTGKSITLTADQTFKVGTSLMFVTENDI